VEMDSQQALAWAKSLPESYAKRVALAQVG
jgi:hypothetical protein